MKNLFTRNLLVGSILFLSGAACTYTAMAFWPPGQSQGKSAKKAAATKKPLQDNGPAIKNDDRLQACFQSLLERDSSIPGGSVRFHITIKNSGEVDTLKLIESDLKDEKFKNCLVSEIRSRRIIPTEERLGAIINHKFTFKNRTPATVSF